MDLKTVSTLQYRNRSLAKQVEAFQSGEKYIQMEAACQKLLRFHHREIKRLESELSRALSETITVRRYWGEIMDDLEKGYQKQIRRLKTELARLKKQNLELAGQRDAAKDKLRERTGQYYAAAAELEDERGKNKKLMAQVNRDFENSSLPSSLQAAGRKKIPNSREKSGRRPGEQPEHKGHPCGKPERSSLSRRSASGWAWKSLNMLQRNTGIEKPKREYMPFSRKVLPMKSITMER